MNRWTGIGRLTRDPEHRVTQSGVECCSFTIAVDRRMKNKDGVREADFIPCTAWRQGSALICQYFRKGDMIGIEGELQSRKYTDKQGNNRLAYEVMVDQITFCGGKKSDNSPATQAAPVPTVQNPQHTAQQTSMGYVPPMSSGEDEEFPF